MCRGMPVLGSQGEIQPKIIDALGLKKVELYAKR